MGLYQLRNSSSKNILKPELDNPGIDGGAADLPERGRGSRSIRIPELRRVKNIVEPGPELERVLFSYFGIFDDREVPVKLAGTKHGSHCGVAIGGAVAKNPTGRRATKCALVDVSRAAAVSTQPIPDIAGCENITVGHSRTQLSPGRGGKTTAVPVNGAGRIIQERKRNAALSRCDSDNAPPVEQLARRSRMHSEWESVLIVQDEALRAVVVGLSVLLF